MKLVRSTLSNDELIAKCREWISRLCKSGGRDWVITIPPRVNEDPDILFAELCNRFSKSSPGVHSPGERHMPESIVRELVRFVAGNLQNMDAVIEQFFTRLPNLNKIENISQQEESGAFRF